MIVFKEGNGRLLGEPAVTLKNGQFDCKGGDDFNSCALAIKADNGQVFSMTAVEFKCDPAKCLWLRPAHRGKLTLIPILRTANNVTIELPLYGNGSYQYRFHVAGFKW